MLIGNSLKTKIEKSILPFKNSSLQKLVNQYGCYVIKFVDSQWADHYTTAKPLKNIGNTCTHLGHSYLRNATCIPPFIRLVWPNRFSYYL